MSQSTSLYPALAVDAAGQHLVSHAGTVLLLRAAETAGLAAALSSSLMPWRKPNAVHDPGKIIVDLAVSIAAGGDCLADLDQLRSQTAVMGQVASDPTVSRLITALAANADRALAAIGSATAQTRARVWSSAGEDAPDHQVTAEIPLVIDLDATLITAHSEKLDAAPNFKKGFGFHPRWGSSTTARPGPENRWRCCCGPGTRARTPPQTTSASSSRRWRSCPTRSPASAGIGSAARS